MNCTRDFKKSILVCLGILFLNTHTVAAPSAPYALGEQKTIVLMVNFQDNASQPMSLAQANDVVFVNANNFFKENSFGKTWLTGSVFGWYTLPLSQVNCSVNNIAAYAQQAATAAGVDLSQYNRYVYIVPYSDTCHPAVGATGGQKSSLWLSTSTLNLGYFTHEMGHNLGLLHSYNLDCGATILGSNCTRNAYGDYFDTMGGPNARHYNAYQKERLGWLNYNNTPPIMTITSSGTYTIEAYETNTMGNKALKILKSVDPVSGGKTYYYVELRQGIGFDASIATYAPAIVNGVLIHMGKEDNPDSSDLLDMTPGSAADFNDWQDAALAVGRTYTDSAAGISINLVSLQNGIATVDVSIGSTIPCIRANPTVIMSPSTSAAVKPGTLVAYTVSVKNNDSTGCAASILNLEGSVPSGWISNLSSASLNLSPGTTASSILSVTSSSTAAAGLYNVSAKAVNSGANLYSAMASASYSVASVSILSAAVKTDKSVYLKSSTVIVTSTVMSGGVSVAGALVSVSITKPNGSISSLSAVTDSQGQAIVTLQIPKNKMAVGSYRVNISAVSGAQSASASTSFIAQ
ncbi:NEW3 domain-containing protein [Bdellovibrio svalbardensis]|uniref:NEW3 domain-containing protein n=1 Tax=Bdellovibrio svalbardensis TaxID=2972972 RepID=A0ABT6DJ12_9BACT|nr:NEW3 domain-containing protein [Bdellovibrio svalbardensis]MDG0816504.1 NEW3 domain-containing protein [Bdellovibrio svalbardensis]